MRPAYKLKNCRERLARYSNHLMFLTKGRTHGIIPQGLRVILPVHSIKVDTIVSTINSPSYKLAKEPTCICTPLAGNAKDGKELHRLCGKDTRTTDYTKGHPDEL